MTTKDFKAGAKAAGEAGKIKNAKAEAAAAPKEKRPRVNLALSPEQYDYIKCVAKAGGYTQQEFIHLMIDEYRAAHTEEYTTIKKLQAKLERH